MTTLLPFFYLFIGIVIGRLQYNIKTTASLILTKLAIPFVIIWNVSLYSKEMGLVIVLTMISILVIFYFLHLLGKDAISGLCFCYLNIGWLGLPIAHSLFGDEVVRLVLAAYIGSSIVGNSIGASCLKKEQFSIVKALSAPPVIALIIGCLLIPMKLSIEEYGYYAYILCKFLMSFLGMMILGIWLSETSLTKSDTLVYTKSYMLRILMLSIVVFTILEVSQVLNLENLYHQLPWLLLICFLPPAANIIVLETSYSGTGTSAVRISVETMVSILVIAFYSLVIHFLNL